MGWSLPKGTKIPGLLSWQHRTMLGEEGPCTPRSDEHAARGNRSASAPKNLSAVLIFRRQWHRPCFGCRIYSSV